MADYFAGARRLTRSARLIAGFPATACSSLLTVGGHVKDGRRVLRRVSAAREISRTPRGKFASAFVAVATNS